MEEDTKKLFEIGVNELPSHIPLFPLDNVLLLPFGKMPLNIFETRYVKMVLDSLKKQRLIGIVQPKDNSGEFFNIGCMGKITSFIETPDNRIVLNLDGICRFKITDSQLSQGGYYNANVETIDFVEDINVKVGDLISPSQMCGSVIQLDPMIVTGEVTEKNITQIIPKQKVSIELLDGRSVEGQISYISNSPYCGLYIIKAQLYFQSVIQTFFWAINAFCSYSP